MSDLTYDFGRVQNWLLDLLTDSGNGPGCGMSRRPEFYSGRGVRSGDLSPRSLAKLYSFIEKVEKVEHSLPEGASEAFVQMVCKTPLSATDFLNNLYGYMNSGFTWSEKHYVSESGMDVGPDRSDEDGGASRYAIGMATIFSRLWRRQHQPRRHGGGLGASPGGLPATNRSILPHG